MSERIDPQSGQSLPSDTELSARCEELRADVERAETRAISLAEQLRDLTRRLATAELERSHHAGLLDRVRQTSVYRLLRRFGLWGWLDDAAVELPADIPRRLEPKKTLKKIVVDLTPVLPGGENGGAKVMTLELLRHLAALHPECEFVLLTAERSHDELATLDAPNVVRLCIDSAGMALKADGLASASIRKSLDKVLPVGVKEKLSEARREMASHRRAGSLVRDLDGDLLFCPFTAAYYFDPSVPLVGVIYDLQHIYYPQFFSPAEQHNRDRDFRQMCRVASRLVCISDYVKGTVLQNFAVEAQRVQTVHIQLPHRLKTSSMPQRQKVCDELGLKPERFLLYPANFWLHKNHPMLLTAFSMYRHRQPTSDLKLVLTGSPGAGRDDIREAATLMGLGDAVVFPGYLSNDDFAALFDSSLALIFPSLFEGFGMPLVEAMAARKPILSSKATSLPEVAGDAALLFDARRPAEIVAAIARIDQDPELQAKLSDAGPTRLDSLGGPKEMATAYWNVFLDAIGNPAALPSGVYGAFEDGWLGGAATVVMSGMKERRELVIRLAAPEWVPLPAITVNLSVPGQAREGYRIERGGTVELRRGLDGAGVAELTCEPLFQPSACGLGEDSRYLGCQIEIVEVVDNIGQRTPLASLKYG